MTKGEWLGSTDLEAMWKVLSGNASGRKLRLFAVACCRRVWHLLGDDRSKLAVEVAERFADGHATQDELDAAREAGMAAWIAAWAGAVGEADWDAGRDSAWAACAATFDVVSASSHAAAGWDNDPASRAALLRDIYHPWLPALDPAVGMWNGGILKGLAREAYEHRLLPSGHLDSQRLAILADALEEAGAATELVTHLRGPGPHVRGCHVVDLVLGKS